ncbi:hypothetical protein [Paracoccus sp. SY]|uniref:hypothetical protein n=1 Tax=Paracoccus sp. SY TaxID=1330255 RepID=UPI001304F9A9|nr:hypothetical protein [Paracoccus sp. SY]
METDARLRSQAGIGQRRQDRAGRTAITPDADRLARLGQPFAQLHHLQHIAAAVVHHVDEAAALDDVGLGSGGDCGAQRGSQGQDQAKSCHGAILPIDRAGENHVLATVLPLARRPNVRSARAVAPSRYRPAPSCPSTRPITIHPPIFFMPFMMGPQGDLEKPASRECQGRAVSPLF